MENTPLAEKQRKQKYLREHIIQEQLDPEEFSKFLSEKKSNGFLKRHWYRCLDFRRTGPNSPGIHQPQTSTHPLIY